MNKMRSWFGGWLLAHKMLLAWMNETQRVNALERRIRELERERDARRNTPTTARDAG